MIKRTTLLIFFFIFNFCTSQKLTTSLESSFKVNYDNFLGFDTMNNFYFTKDNVIIKKSKNQKWEYKNIALGKITSVDIINPLQIVLFYEAFNTAILLDNQLNEVQKIEFTKINSSIIASNVALSSRNQLWFYNTINQKLGLLSFLKNSISEFPVPVQGTIKFVQSDFNTFYWIDEINNWYSCNIFGKTDLISNLPAYDKIQIIDSERILFSKDNSLYLLNKTSKSIFEIEIVENSLENFYYKDQILSIFTNQQIKNFKIKLP
jgi:hypothetical protein